MAASRPENNFSLRVAPGLGKHGVPRKRRRVPPQPLDAEDLCRRLYIVIAEGHAGEERGRNARVAATETHHRARDDKIRRQTSSKLQKPAARYCHTTGTLAAHPSRTGTVESMKDKPLRKGSSHEEKFHGRNQLRQPRILEQSVDVRAARDRQSHPMEGSMEVQGIRVPIHRDAVPSGPSSKSVVEQMSMISLREDDSLTTRPRSPLMTIGETKMEDHVDWSQSDETLEREDGMRNSLWSIKGRVSGTKQSLDQKMTMVSEEIEHIPSKSTRFAFFARFKRLL